MEIIFSKASEYLPIWKDIHIDSPSEDENEKDEQDFPIPERKRPHKFLILCLTAALAALAIIGALVIVDNMTKSKSAHPNQPCYCGNSVEEAKALGCKFVPLSGAYLPPHCQADLLDEEFNCIGPNPDNSWTYYADYERTTTTDLETIATFAGTSIRFYNDWEWHVMHRLFYWRKLQRAQFSGVTIEPRFNTDAHISHCARLILSRNLTSTTVSGVSMGDEIVTEERLKNAVVWDDIRDGYGTHPPPGYMNNLQTAGKTGS